MVTVRSQDSNGRALLGKAIIDTDWTPLYRMDTCNEMTESFYRRVMGVIDYHLALMTVKHHTKDKPWVTDQFRRHRRLIRCRQHALMSGQNVRYRAYRNRVEDITAQVLRQEAGGTAT